MPPLQQPRCAPLKVALFKNLPDTKLDPDVAEALRKAATWLSDAGYQVEEAEPPHFAEAARLWRDLLMTEAEEGLLSWIEKMGDDPIKCSVNAMKPNSSRLNLQAYVRGQARRTTILREWRNFFQTYPLLLLPISGEKPFAIDADQAGPEAMLRTLNAQSPMLATAAGSPRPVWARGPFGVQS